MEMKLLAFLFLFILCFFSDVANGGRPINSGDFNVLDYGAKANGQSDDSQAFQDAWKAACNGTGAVKLVVPSGTYFVGPLKFAGPCVKVQSLTVQVDGTLKASTDLNMYVTGDDWIEFGWVQGLVLTGSGTFDGQGDVSWPLNNCPKKKNCKVLPTSIKFVNTTNTVVDGITSLNSKFFHIALVDCYNFSGKNMKIVAPGTSPNTDGIHIERNSGVSISQSEIGTGDDCISIGQGNTDVTIKSIKCGPGHGISIGSLGRYQGEGDVRNLVVKDCTLTDTQNGLRIKTWQNSPGVSKVANMTFDNIVMHRVGNPIIIDQTYCPYSKCDSTVPSRVKISDVKFKNIHGTSTTPVAVTLECSQGQPCENVSLEEVRLDYIGTEQGLKTTASCHNIKAAYAGTQVPPPCE